MNGQRNRVLMRVAVGGILLSLVGAPACAGGGSEGAGEICATYACINAAVLSGTVAAPAEAMQLRVKYCSEQACVDGVVQLAAAEAAGGAGACTDERPPTWGDGVCFTRSTDGALQVHAQLTRQDDQSLPPDGERYTLEIVDVDSGETLLDEKREADYETTRRDNCHWCWRAEMSL